MAKRGKAGRHTSQKVSEKYAKNTKKKNSGKQFAAFEATMHQKTISNMQKNIPKLTID
jgi:hypothetical protein